MPTRWRTVLNVVAEEGSIYLDQLVKRFRGKDLPRARILPIVIALQGKGHVTYIRKRKLVIATEKAYATKAAA
jgi:hypothetical protein